MKTGISWTYFFFTISWLHQSMANAISKSTDLTDPESKGDEEGRVFLPITDLLDLNTTTVVSKTDLNLPNNDL